MLGLGMSHLSAQEAPFTYHFGVHFGENYADESSKMRDNGLYGIRTTVMLTPFYGLSVGYDRLESIDIKETSDTVDAERYYMQVEVDGEEQYHTVPYITFGIGYEDLSKDVMVADSNGEYKKYDVSQVYLTGGMGFRYNFIPEISIYAEGNVLYKTDTTDVDYTVLAGIQYHINATTCDKTYITDRINEKPQERTVIHTGPVNNRSAWKQYTPVPKVSTKTEPVTKTTVLKRPKAVTETKKTLRTKPVQSAKKVAPVQTKSSVSGYYVVLGAYKTDEGLQSMLRRLDSAKVSYILRDDNKRGMTYVLSGAYASSSDARKALRKLKRIQKDAYIAKLK